MAEKDPELAKQLATTVNTLVAAQCASQGKPIQNEAIDVEPDFCPKCALGRLTQAQKAFEQAERAMELAAKKLELRMPEEAGHIRWSAKMMFHQPCGGVANRINILKAKVAEGAMLDE